MTDHTPLKRCAQCGESKPATTEYFYRSQRAKSGLDGRCKDCLTAYKHAYAEANREKITADNRARYEANREERLAQQAEYRRANPDVIRQRKKAAYERDKLTDRYIERARKWQRNNRAAINALGRARYAANRETEYARRRELRLAKGDRANDANRRYKAANPDQAQLHAERRLARKRSLPATLTAQDWQDALNYFGGCCAACGSPPGLWHTLAMDHWIPLSDASCPGTTPNNIVPLCHGTGGCNNSKGSGNALEWAISKFGKRKGQEVVAKILAYFDGLTAR